MKCIEEAIEEGNLFDDDEDNEDDDDNDYYDEDNDNDDGSDDDNDDCVCAIQPILKQAIAVVMPEARSAMANVSQTNTTGGSIIENLSIDKPLVIKLKYFQPISFT